MTERIEANMNPSELFGEAIKYLLVAAVGWLISNFSQQRKFEEFEKRIVAPLRDSVSKLEGASTLFATREELKSEIASLRTDFKESVVEIKQLIRELRSER